MKLSCRIQGELNRVAKLHQAEKAAEELAEAKPAEPAKQPSAPKLSLIHILFSALESCADLLEGFGGHELAAGFTISEENIDAFRALSLIHISGQLPGPGGHRDRRLVLRRPGCHHCRGGGRGAGAGQDVYKRQPRRW